MVHQGAACSRADLPATAAVRFSPRSMAPAPGRKRRAVVAAQPSDEGREKQHIRLAVSEEPQTAAATEPAPTVAAT